jgi:hypothetical protein
MGDAGEVPGERMVTKWDYPGMIGKGFGGREAEFETSSRKAAWFKRYGRYGAQCILYK